MVGMMAPTRRILLAALVSRPKLDVFDIELIFKPTLHTIAHDIMA